MCIIGKAMNSQYQLIFDISCDIVQTCIIEIVVNSFKEASYKITSVHVSVQLHIHTTYVFI